MSINLPGLGLRGIHHVAIICSDYERSTGFYVDVLGLEVLAEHYREDRQSYKLDLGVGRHYIIELFSFPAAPARVTQPEAVGLRHLAFEVEDVHRAAVALAGHGIVVEPVRVDPYTGKQFTFLSDPNGLPLELYEV
jgi:glyoxylase I family protein